MNIDLLQSARALGVATVLAVAGLSATSLMPIGVTSAAAEELKGGTLRVAILDDLTNYDPQQFSTVNFFLIKNLYDSLIEYTEDGEAVASLASEWDVAEDNRSITLKLRDDVTFHSGTPFNAEAVAATLKKAADPERGKNVYATMSVVKDWEVVDNHTIAVNMNGPVPTRQILDLLQFVIPIDPAGMETVETKPAGTGPFLLDNRKVGQEIRLKANPDYWRDDQPVLDEIVFTIFSEDGAATAALESGAVDVIYNGSSRSAVRLRDAGYQVLQGPGKLVQVLRINSTRAPFDNKKFRQAFNHLINREANLRVGYAGLGQISALPWAPASPAFDASYNEIYAYDVEKGKALLAESGLSAEEMSDWKLLVYGNNEAAPLISQVLQSSLADAGVEVELDIRQGAEYVDALLAGQFDAVYAGVGNVQKFPSRVTTNSIYRTENNPVFGDPHPHPAYVEAINQVNSAFGDDVQKSYDHLNQVLVDEAFVIPSNSYETGLIVAADNVSGFMLDIDNLFIGRTLGFK